jgi:hypothetical protein
MKKNEKTLNAGILFGMCYEWVGQANEILEKKYDKLSKKKKEKENYTQFCIRAFIDTLGVMEENGLI